VSNFAGLPMRHACQHTGKKINVARIVERLLQSRRRPALDDDRIVSGDDGVG
jgi:hypothetical protein